jgi:hypothetical protein
MMHRLSRCGDLLPVADAGIEYVNIVAAEVLGGEDLNVPKAGADRALAKTAEHECKESTDEEKAGDTASDHH